MIFALKSLPSLASKWANTAAGQRASQTMPRSAAAAQAIGNVTSALSQVSGSTPSAQAVRDALLAAMTT